MNFFAHNISKKCIISKQVVFVIVHNFYVVDYEDIDTEKDAATREDKGRGAAVTEEVAETDVIAEVVE